MCIDKLFIRDQVTLPFSVKKCLLLQLICSHVSEFQHRKGPFKCLRSRVQAMPWFVSYFAFTFSLCLFPFDNTDQSCIM